MNGRYLMTGLHAQRQRAGVRCWNTTCQQGAATPSAAAAPWLFIEPCEGEPRGARPRLHSGGVDRYMPHVGVEII